MTAQAKLNSMEKDSAKKEVDRFHNQQLAGPVTGRDAHEFEMSIRNLATERDALQERLSSAERSRDHMAQEAQEAIKVAREGSKSLEVYMKHREQAEQNAQVSERELERLEHQLRAARLENAQVADETKHQRQRTERLEQELAFEAEKHLVSLQGHYEAMDQHERNARAEIAEAVDESIKLAEDRDQYRETIEQHERRFMMLSQSHANAEESLAKARIFKAVDEATQAAIARCQTVRNGAETMS